MKIIAKNCSLVFQKFQFEPKSYDITSFVDNNCLRVGGTVTDTPGFMATDFISVKGATTISGTLAWGAPNVAALAFYDAAKNFISDVHGIEGTPAVTNGPYSITDIPSNAVYCRAGGWNYAPEVALSLS